MDNQQMIEAWRALVHGRMPVEFEGCANVHTVDLEPAEYVRLVGPPNDPVGPLDGARISDWPELPQLTICGLTGRVSHQEGRHRVAAALESGLPVVPIVVEVINLPLAEAGDFDALSEWCGQAQPLPSLPWLPKITSGSP